MPLEFNGNTVNAVTFNGSTVNEVQFNGVTVWQAISEVPLSYTVKSSWYPSGSTASGKQFSYDSYIDLPNGTRISSTGGSIKGSTIVNVGDTITFNARSFGLSVESPIYGKRAVIYLNDVLVADVHNDTISTSSSARATYNYTVPANIATISSNAPTASNIRIDGTYYHTTTLRLYTRARE